MKISNTQQIKFHQLIKEQFGTSYSMLFRHNNDIQWGWGEYFGLWVKGGIAYIRSEDDILIRKIYNSFSNCSTCLFQNPNGKWTIQMPVTNPFTWLETIVGKLDSLLSQGFQLTGFVASTAYKYKLGECNNFEVRTSDTKNPDLYFTVPEVMVNYQQSGGLSIRNYRTVPSSNLEKTIQDLWNDLGVNVAEDDSVNLRGVNWADISEGIDIVPSEEQYLQAVSSLKKEMVREGVPKVVLARQANGEFQGEAVELFRTLRQCSPTPYEFLFEMPEYQLVGCSPEMLVEVVNGSIVLKVLSGTSLRGKTKKEEYTLTKKFTQDPKQVIEHLTTFCGTVKTMKDICSPASVTINKVLEIEKFAHIQHFGSEIRGQSVHPTVSTWASFLPTLSGTPADRAYCMLRNHEHFERGLYGGIFGYFNNSQALFCKVIRSIYLDSGRFYTCSGAGLTDESEPEDELLETKNKMRSCLYAIKLNQKRSG